MTFLPITNMKENSKIWLHRLFNSSSTDLWLLVSYLHRYSLPGIQYYLLQILRTKTKAEISLVLPQLVHIYNATENNFILHAFLIEQGLEAYFLIERDEHHLKEEIIMNNRRRRKFKTNRFKIDKNKKCRSNYTLYPCLIIPYQRRSSLAIQGLLMVMAGVIASIFNLELAKKLCVYKNKFRVGYRTRIHEEKNKYEQNFLQSSFNTILPSIRFFRELVNVCKRLKCLPKSVRQCGLEIEIEVLNSHLPAEIEFIFNKKKIVMNIVSEFSYVLDSAENAPYFILFESVQDFKVRDVLHENKKFSCSDISVESNNDNVIDSEFYVKDFILTLENSSHADNIPNKTISGNNHNTGRQRDIDELKNASFILEKLYGLEMKNEHSIDELNETRERIIKNLKCLKSDKLPTNLTLNEKIDKIRNESLYKDYNGYEIVCAIIKRGSDIRHEVVALQILNEMKNIFKEERLDIYLKTYKIFLIDRKSACIEAITNADSIHNIKKRHKSILNYFKSQFNDGEYEKAITRFISSLVGYSLVTYFLQIKDRHNGNILIDDHGSIIHVDFGFILGNYPGFYCVERAPFKFSVEYNEILGNKLVEFKTLFHKGFLSLRKNCDRLCRILEIFCDKNYIKSYNKNVLEAFRERFKLGMCDRDVDKWISGLITWSVNSMGTGLYDSYQYFSHGYMK